MSEAVAKFDPARAADYAAQSRIALAGYDACHELAACLLAAEFDGQDDPHLLVAGAGGTAQEIRVSGPIHPQWRFTAVDPSPSMLATAQAAVSADGVRNAVEWHQGVVSDLPDQQTFDGAMLIGVLHHLQGREAKRDILLSIHRRLRDGAPLILACNRGAYGGNPRFLAAWSQRWHMAGASAEEVRVKMGKILQGAEPPHSDQEVHDILAACGFVTPQLFFSSLFWGAWIARRAS